MRSRVGRPLAASVVLVLALSPAACSSQQERLADRLQRADEYAEAGQEQEALGELRSALGIEPQNAEVNFRIARMLHEEGRLSDAAFFYRETTRLDPTRSDAALAEAKLVLFDDTERASELVEDVIAREPDNATAYVRRAEIALARGDARDALQAALSARALDPKNGSTWMTLGLVHQARLRDFTARGEPVPASVYQDAEKAFLGAIDRFETGVTARVELGRLYAVWPGHGEQALAAFRGAVQAADGHDRRAQAAGAAMSYARAVGDPDLLREMLGVVVESRPDDMEAWRGLAALEERSRAGGAEAVYRNLLDQRPDDIEAHVAYAAWLGSRDRAADAIAHLEEQVRAGREPAVALDQIVALQLRDRDLEAAEAAQRRLASQHPDHPRAALAEGRVALASGRSSEAVAALRRYVRLEETAEGQRLLATAELRARDFTSAAAAIDRAIALQSGSTVALLRLKAVIHTSAGDHARALETLNLLHRQAGKLRPRERLMLARTLYGLGRDPAGSKVLEELLALQDPPVGAAIEYAQREMRRQPERVRAYLQRALRKSPTDAPALRLLAQLDLDAGRPDQALARIDEATAGGKATPALMLLRAQVLAAREDWARAEEEARRAFVAQPALPGALELLAKIYVAQGRVDEAIDSFEEADRAGALPVSGQQLLARLHLTAGHRERAKALYEKLLAADSDQPGTKNDLAWLLAEEGADLERALALAQEAQNAEPQRAEIADTLGYVYLKQGRYDPALQQFETAIELAQRGDEGAETERPEYQYHLGLALKALGRHEQAARAFERALALDASFADADEARRELEGAKASLASGPG